MPAPVMAFSPGLALNRPARLEKRPGPDKLLISHARCDHIPQYLGIIVALFNGTRQPVKGFGCILIDTAALRINQAHPILRIDIPLLRRL